MPRGLGIVEIDGAVVVAEDNKAVVLYESSPYLYVCSAAIGTALGTAAWQVKRIDTTSGVVIKWADGDDSYNQAATNLATVAGYSYS